VREVKSRSAQVGDFNGVVETVSRLEHAYDIGTDGVVPQQNISDAAYEHAWFHNTFATAIFCPERSKAWQAHAMQGSKECTVRKTSSGSSGRASGV